MEANNLVATVISPMGEIESVPLSANEHERLRQMQRLVGGYIEVVALPGHRHMIINENGKDGPHAINDTATAIAHEAQAISPCDYIAGVALITPAEAMQ